MRPLSEIISPERTHHRIQESSKKHLLKLIAEVAPKILPQIASQVMLMALLEPVFRDRMPRPYSVARAHAVVAKALFVPYPQLDLQTP